MKSQIYRANTTPEASPKSTKRLYVGDNNHYYNMDADGKEYEVGNFPDAIITSTQFTVVTSSNTILVLNGEYFTENTIVEVVGVNAGAVSNITYLNSNQIQFTYNSSASLGVYDIVLTYKGYSKTYSNMIKQLDTVWMDLRLGGVTITDGNAAGNDIRYRSGMSMGRDANGIYFTGATPRSSWFKYEALKWTRGSNKKLSWIVTAPTAAMMVGIFSDATDETSTAQYAQAECQGYFNSSTALRGLYGNNGTVGTAGNQSHSVSISSSGVYRLEFEGDGGAGQTFSIYQLPSANETDWDDTTNLLDTWNIGGSLAPDETNIFPGGIPVDGGAQRYVAVQVI